MLLHISIQVTLAHPYVLLKLKSIPVRYCQFDLFGTFPV